MWGEHAGGLIADHLAAHAGTSGSLGARARAMDYADPCCTMRASLSWEFLPTGIPQSARRTAHSESRTRGAVGWTASPQPAGRSGHRVPVVRPARRADCGSTTMRCRAKTHFTRWSPPGSNPQIALPCVCPLHALHVPFGGVALPTTRTRWWPPRAHTARRVFCTLGATTH